MILLKKEEFIFIGNRKYIDVPLNYIFLLDMVIIRHIQIEVGSRRSDEDWSFLGTGVSSPLRGWDGVWSTLKYLGQHTVSARPGFHFTRRPSVVITRAGSHRRLWGTNV